jgi:hypothetical protein
MQIRFNELTAIFDAYEQIDSNSCIAATAGRFRFHFGACFGKSKTSNGKYQRLAYPQTLH